jgi:hypothetical protein
MSGFYGSWRFTFVTISVDPTLTHSIQSLPSHCISLKSVLLLLIYFAHLWSDILYHDTRFDISKNTNIPFLNYCLETNMNIYICGLNMSSFYILFKCGLRAVAFPSISNDQYFDCVSDISNSKDRFHSCTQWVSRIVSRSLSQSSVRYLFSQSVGYQIIHVFNLKGSDDCV